MAESSKRASSNRTSSKRASIMPSAPKAPTKIDHSAIIADKAILTGTHPITVLGRAVIHPYAKVVSQAGPVEIGDGAIVWEKAVVGVAVPDGAVVGAEMSTQSVLLGRNVVVETGAIVEGEVVGEGTVVECFARIGLGARIGKFCKIACYISIPADAVVPDYTVVYGPNLQRIDTTAQSNELVNEIRDVAHAKQLNGLKQLIPSNLAKWSS